MCSGSRKLSTLAACNSSSGPTARRILRTQSSDFPESTPSTPKLRVVSRGANIPSKAVTLSMRSFEGRRSNTEPMPPHRPMPMRHATLIMRRIVKLLMRLKLFVFQNFTRPSARFQKRSAANMLDRGVYWHRKCAWCCGSWRFFTRALQAGVETARTQSSPRAVRGSTRGRVILGPSSQLCCCRLAFRTGLAVGYGYEYESTAPSGARALRDCNRGPDSERDLGGVPKGDRYSLECHSLLGTPPRSHSVGHPGLPSKSSRTVATASSC